MTRKTITNSGRLCKDEATKRVLWRETWIWILAVYVFKWPRGLFYLKKPSNKRSGKSQ